MKRSYAPELMDDFSFTDNRIDDALKELNVINKFLGGSNVSVNGISYFRKRKKFEALKILDFGSGGTNLFLQNIFSDDFVVNADKNIRTCKFLKEKNMSKYIVCADAFNPPFKKKSFDVIHASLFFHHFEEEGIIKLLKYFSSIAESGIVINDLRRSILALIGIKILTLFFSKSEFVKYDAPLSVKRGFKKKELKNILRELDFAQVILRRKWAFRWMLILKLKRRRAREKSTVK